MVTKTIIVT